MSSLSETLNFRAFYPVSGLSFNGVPMHKVRARATGEKRPPKKDEWYLSGSIIAAYRAAEDMTTPLWIAEMFEVKSVITYEVIRPLGRMQIRKEK